MCELSKDRKKEGSLRFYKPKFSYIFCDMDGESKLTIVYIFVFSSSQLFSFLMCLLFLTFKVHC